MYYSHKYLILLSICLFSFLLSFVRYLASLSLFLQLGMRKDREPNTTKPVAFASRRLSLLHQHRTIAVTTTRNRALDEQKKANNPETTRKLTLSVNTFTFVPIHTHKQIKAKQNNVDAKPAYNACIHSDFESLIRQQQTANFSFLPPFFACYIFKQCVTLLTAIAL